MTGSSNASLHSGLCRDCLTRVASADAAQCPACRSPRILRHPELDALGIAHIDCDAFFAAVEKRDNPALVDKPVIIGGGRRGVVATACYNARIYGVRSAMPMFKARKACPQAVVIAPNFGKYAEASAQVKARMRQLTPLVESLSIDEAFLDLNGTQDLHKSTPAESLARLARTIEREVGISVSIGLSHNKFLAKLASDLDKPRGFYVIGRTDSDALLADMPVTKIWGVGRATHKKLERDGIRRIADLRAIDEVELIKRYGKFGAHIYALAHGRDTRTVTPGRETKSISSETTFETDISDATQLEKILRRLCERTAYRCKKKHLAGRTLVLKLKSAQFATQTRNRQLPQPTQMTEIMFDYGRALLHEALAQNPNRAYRLLGIGVANLVDADYADQPDLADPDMTRRINAERAIDDLRSRFGHNSISKGYDS